MGNLCAAPATGPSNLANQSSYQNLYPNIAVNSLANNYPVHSQSPSVNTQPGSFTQDSAWFLKFFFPDFPQKRYYFP